MMKIRRILLKIGVLILMAGSAQADSMIKYYFDKFKDMQRQVLSEKSSMRPRNSEPQCELLWSPFKERNSLRIDYYTGYNENRQSLVRDSFERLALLGVLLSSCEDPLMTFCGFKPTKDSIFTRKFTLPSGQERTLEIRLHDASISPDDAKNRENPEQWRKSHQVRTQFLSSARQSDILVYSGHSRLGAGPDFFPEDLPGEAGEQLREYRSNKQGPQELIEVLNLRVDKGLPLLMMGSCNSQKYFHRRFAKGTKKLQSSLLVTYADIYENDVFLAFFRLIHLLATDSCPQDFSKSFEKFKLNSYSK